MLIEKPLISSRITLRNCKRADLPILTSMWFDEENGKYLSDPTSEYADEKFQKALDGIENNPKGYFMTALLNGTDKIIGSAFIFPDEKEGSFEIAYCVNKNYWRKGFGREIISLLSGWIADHGGKEITAEAAKENTASNRLLLDTGFKVCGESSFKKYNMDITYESFLYKLNLN